MLICWVLFPALLLALATGWGRALEIAAGRRLPLALLPALGFAGIAACGLFLTLAEATAAATAPVAAVIGAAGLAALRGRGLPNAWGVASAAAVFAVYAAPIVLSGEPTFAGYIRLDDTATWMALTDRVMEHGRSLEGLGPSTYEATLAVNLGDGYPIGAFIPLGVGRDLIGQDVAWLIQPYMAWLAALLALALWSLAQPVIGSRHLCALAVFVAAQPALLFGYYVWGGVKEVAAAMLIASIAACANALAGEAWSRRATIAPALLVAALAGVLSTGGLLWLAPAGAALALLAVLALPIRAVLFRALWLTGLVAVLTIPVLAADGVLPPTSSPLTDADARGNLLGALEPAQVVGIWPAGDFRFDPDGGLLAFALIAIATVAAAVGITFAWVRRAWGAFAFVAGTLAAAAIFLALGSPWVGAKALATASPAFLLAAMLGAAWLWAEGRRAGAWGLVAVVAGGVVWSNALAYRDVNLAPRAQLTELETIGELVAGEGPTLLTEYQPYGARHFLREAEAESVSELRRRVIPLADGGVVEKGGSADTDELDPEALTAYRTLVLRRSPVQSRPPAAYERLWAGSSYEVWQRPTDTFRRDQRLPLGGTTDPVAVPSCEQVMQLGRSAAPSGALVAASRPRPIRVPFSEADYPERWRISGVPDHLQPRGGGTMRASVEIPESGRYEVWLEGSIRSEATLRVDGERAGAVRHVLNNAEQYVRLGEAGLGQGRHLLELDFGEADLHPGSGGGPAAIGPLILSRGEAADARLVRVDPRQARRLCGLAWDWIEADG